jgi:23S rRNA (cytidine1920-2'-O)/16S rRNA (cytidine1409-2'-O)-methyltransferase
VRTDGVNIKSPKIRLDKLLVEKGISPTLKQSGALIMAGAILVGSKRIDKVGTLVPSDAEIRINGEDHPYVSRGGLKLRSALKIFRLNVQGLTVVDVGASTGGFTDCLLQEGAAKVYALDVAYGQLAWELRQDLRVVVLERTNIRHFDGTAIGDSIDMATIDTSFISLKLVIPPTAKLVRAGGVIVALIKPQFEVERTEVENRGVVEDPVLHRRVIRDIASFSRKLKLEVMETCESPLLGPAGNKEFFIYLKNTG